MAYTYTYGAEIGPDMDILESEIQQSQVGQYYVYLRWDAEDQLLKIIMTHELIPYDSSILNNTIINYFETHVPGENPSGGGLSNIDGGGADAVYGGVIDSPVDGGEL